jgi:hypothetical protein
VLHYGNSVAALSNQSITPPSLPASTPPSHPTLRQRRGRGEPARWLEIVGRLLAAWDLIGCKELTECAVEANQHLSGVNELLTVANILLASQLPSGRPILWRCSSSSPTQTLPPAVMRSFTSHVSPDCCHPRPTPMSPRPPSYLLLLPIYHCTIQSIMCIE